MLPAPLKRLGGPLADHVGLELGQAGEENHHQPPHSAVHVDVLAAKELNHDHPHAPLGELLQRVEDVPGSPAQPVQLRHHEHVAGLGVKEEPAALGPVPKVRAPAGSAQRLVKDRRLGQLHGGAMLADHLRLDFGRRLLLPRAGAGNAVDCHGVVSCVCLLRTKTAVRGQPATA